MLDRDLAERYEVPTKRLNEAVSRNRSRFPDDFMLELTDAETDRLRSQISTSTGVVATGIIRMSLRSKAWQCSRGCCAATVPSR